MDFWTPPRLNYFVDVPSSFPSLSLSLVGVLRGNTIRGNTTRNSERKMAL